MRLVIHAGFGKCGSSTIQTALAAKQADLKQQSIFLFGKGLAINYGAPRADAPFWFVAETFRDVAKRNTIAAKLSSELQKLKSAAPNATAVLSAEILGDPGFARFFRGVDELCDTTLVFYIRPQFEWIPSAWKQWELKSGVSLEAFVRNCLKKGTPRFLRAIEGWAAALPRAKVTVRVLGQASAESGDPARDFFRILGLDGKDWKAKNRQVNPSPDFALLHILNKNPWLFRSREDNEPFKALMRILPDRHLRTNIKMLRIADEERIAEHFASENRALLAKHCGLAEPALEETYDTYFRPRRAGRAYSDVSDMQMVNRGLGILLGILLEELGRKSIFRRPYWKVPQRLLRRLRDRG